MEIDIDDIILISFIERFGEKVASTNIEEIARENGFYHEKIRYGPIAIRVGSDFLPDGFHDELIGKEVGAKGTILLPPERAYGERDSEKVRFIHRNEFIKIPEVGQRVLDPAYGEGTVVKKVGLKFLVDFNPPLAGREVEFEYEIHDKIIDPAEQFSCLVHRVLVCEYETSFENGTGIIRIPISTKDIFEWNKEKMNIIDELFDAHPSLDFLELHEEYDNIAHPKVPGEDDRKADDATESEEIQVGDFIAFNFIEHCDGEIVGTNILQIALENGLEDDDSDYSEYSPAICVVGVHSCPNYLSDKFIGKTVGTKGTVIISHEEAYGMQSNKMLHSIDQNEISTDVEIGSHIHHHKYGDGIIVNKLTKRLVIDFNHEVAGKDVECEYEILERITDPVEQFYRLLPKLSSRMYTHVSFENGKGIISLKVPRQIMKQWSTIKIQLTLPVFTCLPFLQTLEFRETYGYEIDGDYLYLIKEGEFLRESVAKAFYS